jgi:hypothetical protein
LNPAYPLMGLVVIPRTSYSGGLFYWLVLIHLPGVRGHKSKQPPGWHFTLARCPDG